MKVKRGNQDQELGRDRTMAFFRIMNMGIVKKQDQNTKRLLARGLAKARDRFLVRDKDRILEIDRDLERALDHDRIQIPEKIFIPDKVPLIAQALDRILGYIALQNYAERYPLHLQVVAACLNGDDKFDITDIEGVPANSSPLYLIFRHIVILLLGRGKSIDWEIVQSHVDILCNTEWSKENLPFIESVEINDALHMLGLRMTDGITLFEMEWFAEGHPLAPALNAKPSEFAKVIDELLEKNSVEG